MSDNNIRAGSELDALIADKVMGWRKLDFIPPSVWFVNRVFEDLPDVVYFENVSGEIVVACELGYTRFRPSSQIADAWDVIKKLEEHPDEILASITRQGFTKGDLVWQARFRKCGGNQHDYIAQAKDAPLAICLAALLVMPL